MLKFNPSRKVVKGVGIGVGIAGIVGGFLSFLFADKAKECEIHDALETADLDSKMDDWWTRRHGDDDPTEE